MNAVDDLIALYERNDHRAADIAWYADAKLLARRRALAAGVPIGRYLGVVAATSPMQQWSTKDGRRFPNLDAADRVIRWHRGGVDRPGTLPNNARVAKLILDGRKPTDVLGPKTRAFFLALTGRDEIVLDRWALRAIGWPRETITEAEYPAASEPYELAAAKLGIRPSELQAATWTQIRRENHELYR